MATAATDRWLAEHAPEVVELARALVRLPSENRPPEGEERACQEHVAGYLRALGLEPDVFEPDAVSGIAEHPLWWPGRRYGGRPCVAARLAGRGGGRSLLFTGHVDVVPATGSGRHGWWDGEVADGRLYGRGALDMKGGVACCLMALRCLVECGVELAGDVLVETVVDEEFGGANGTLACRLRGPAADAAVLPEPTGLRVCHATRGGRQFRLHASGGLGAMPLSDEPQPSALVALARIATALADAERRRGVPLIQMLLRSGDELPWGTSESVPADGVLELWAEILPGTSQAELEGELHAAVDPVDTGGVRIAWEERTRFLSAASIPPDAPVVEAMRRSLDVADPAATAPFACDAFVLNETGVPTVVCGPGGANAHAPDEHVRVDDLERLTAAYVRLALDWCGASTTG